MTAENRVSITIPDQDKAAVQAAIESIRTKLTPYLIALTKTERRRLPKVGDGTVPFLNKSINYTKTNPQFAPPYINMEELTKDVNAVETLLGFLTPLQQVVSGLDDTVKQAAGESYIACLAFYNSVNRAADMGVLEAKPIYEDLKTAFPRNKKKSQPEETPA